MYIWKKSKLDSKNRVVLPQNLMQILNLNGKKQILWISAKKKEDRDNEFLIEVGVKK